MKPDTFDKPVRVLVGLGVVREIRNALEAYIFLNDAPDYMRNPAQLMALKACKAALLGEIEAETAAEVIEIYLAYAAAAPYHNVTNITNIAAPAEADGWIKWGSGKPRPRGTVDIKVIGGGEVPGCQASTILWDSGYIIAYRPAWIEWCGGEMPVPRGVPIEVRHRDGKKYATIAGGDHASNWQHSGLVWDIVAYRVVS